jgi:ribosome silencing factor RsfS/YbeB/iojap
LNKKKSTDLKNKKKDIQSKINKSKINNKDEVLKIIDYDSLIKKSIDYIIDILKSKNAFNITVINTPDYLTDYFVIASVDNKITLQAIAKYFTNEFFIELKDNELIKFLKDIKIKFDGTYESGWIIIDIYYIWIHLFLPDIRYKYSLERLWNLRNTMKKLGDEFDEENKEITTN